MIDGLLKENLIKTETMKTMKHLILSLLTLTSLHAYAQDDPARVQAIADAITVNCGAPHWGPDSLEAIQNYSLYREFKKQGDNQDDLATKIKYYNDAYVGWKYIYINATSARETPHFDGVDIYKAYAAAADDEATKGAYIDSMLAVYDVRLHCFGETADLTMRKSFAWYSKRNKGNEEYVFNLFNHTVDLFESEEGTSKLKINAAFLAPWMIMAIKAHKSAKVIDEEVVFDIFDEINVIADYNLANGNSAGKYKGAADKCFEYMEKYGYLNPETIGALAEKKYVASPEDIATQVKVYKMLKAAKLYDHPIFFEVAEKVYLQQPSAALATFLAKRASSNKEYSAAIKYMQEANENETDSNAKAKNLLTIAQFYQAKGDYSSARSYANNAADMRPGWGDPFILIGRLYASSGSKCGSGTGWDSQVVVWAAIDMWSKAKNIDPSVTDEAQNLINKYYQYMPSKSDVFLRPEISVGSSFSIGCWIGVTTTVRTAD